MQVPWSSSLQGCTNSRQHGESNTVALRGATQQHDNATPDTLSSQQIFWASGTTNWRTGCAASWLVRSIITVFIWLTEAEGNTVENTRYSIDLNGCPNFNDTRIFSIED